jgi:hypothetical protein
MDRFWPRDVAEIEERPSLINEPLVAPDGTVALPVLQREKPLHAQLCEAWSILGSSRDRDLNEILVCSFVC